MLCTVCFVILKCSFNGFLFLIKTTTKELKEVSIHGVASTAQGASIYFQPAMNFLSQRKGNAESMIEQPSNDISRANVGQARDAQF